MTYNQIEKIEKFIKEVSSVLEDETLEDEELFSKAQSLDECMVASKIGYISLVNWSDCFITSYFEGTTTYYVEIIKNNLKIMLTTLYGILDALPVYPRVCAIKNDLARGRRIKKSIAKREFVAEMAVKYNGEVDFGKLIQEYLKEDNMISLSIDEEAYFKGVLQKLELYLNDVCKEKEKTKQKNQPKQQIFNLTQNAHQVQQTSVEVKISFEDCFKEIDDCETLSQAEADELKKEIEELIELLLDKKGKKKSIKAKIGAILKWIAEKGTDAMIATLPILLQSLKGL